MKKNFIFVFLFYSLKTYAYLGPGMGGGALAALAGFFGALILGLWGILYYPIKRALRKKKNLKDGK